MAVQRTSFSAHRLSFKHQHPEAPAAASLSSLSQPLQTPPRKPRDSTPPNQHSEQRTPPKQRAPSTDSSPIVSSTPSHSERRTRRLSSTSTATRPTPSSVTSSGSYFGPQSTSSGADARSPAARKPPASHSSHGIETSNGPPIALITRRQSSNSGAVRTSQSPADAAFTQQTFTQVPSRSPSSGARNPHTRNNSEITVRAHPEDRKERSRTRSLPSSRATSPSSQHVGETSRDSTPGHTMTSDSQSDYDFAYSHRGASSTRDGGSRRDVRNFSNEDLFLNIAQDTPPRQDGDDDTARIERRRSRIARVANRQSLPANSLTSPIKTTSIPLKASTSTESRIGGLHHRRVSQLPSPSYTSAAREQPQISSVMDGQKSRFGLSVHSSFPLPKSRDQDEAQNHQVRRSSIPESARRTELRDQKHRSSNLTYPSRPTQPPTPLETSPEITSSKADTQPTRDGSESMESTTAPSTVWDELDDLKSRIKKLELTGKLPPTSGAAVSNISSERPRTATTQATSIIASPKHVRRPSVSPPETTVSTTEKGASHPLLHSALAKCKTQVTPALYRVLEATASDALELAAMTGNAGSSRDSVANGATVTERQLRRKADNMCRSLTELCIALCEGATNTSNPTTPALKSPALAPAPRRGSVHTNGIEQQPQRGASAEPDDSVARNSPSRALTRIEARRISLQGMGSAGNSPRDAPDRERTTPTQQSNRYSARANSGLLTRPRRATINNDDQEMEDDATLRVPSRALTDYAQQKRSNRLSREYTSQVPLPDPPNSALLQHSTSLRRANGVVPTIEQSQVPASSSVLMREGSRRYMERSTPPAYPSPTASEGMTASEERRQRIAALTGSGYSSSPRSAIGIGRTGSLSRRLQQNT